MYRTRTVTIDIDFDINSLYIDIALNRFIYICRSKDVDKCSICLTENGIHLYMVLRKDIDFYTMMMLRSILFDDDGRMDFDFTRDIYPQVMFKTKYISNKKHRKRLSHERICYSLDINVNRSA